MKFNVTLDRDEDGVWVVECPAIPGCVSQGKTKDEALENVRDAIKTCLEARAERGLFLTLESVEVEVPGLERQDRVALLRQAKGIWQDREDLPTLSDLRGEFDRR